MIRWLSGSPCVPVQAGWVFMDGLFAQQPSTPVQCGITR
jgi:hypothetical protein